MDILVDSPSSSVETFSVFTLSYIGDAWYELWCRQQVLAFTRQSNNVHKKVTQIVCCQAQATIATAIFPLLNTNEQKIYKRGKNCKRLVCPKNASMKDYRAATGFECLIGYWYLTQKIERFTALMENQSLKELMYKRLS